MPRYTVEIRGSKGWEIHFETDDADDALGELDDLDDHTEAWRLTCEPLDASTSGRGANPNQEER